MPGIRFLFGHAVDAAFHIETARIERIGGDDAGPHRAGAVEAFALVPLAAMAALDIAPAHVIDHGVAEDMLHCIGLGDVLAGGADDHAELHFPAEWGRYLVVCGGSI